MKPKNYVVIPLGKCSKSDYALNFSDKYSIYEEMVDIQIQSITRNLKGIDEVVIVSGEYETVEKLFYQTFKTAYELWKSKPCNIICSAADVLFINSANIFEEYVDFSLFGPNAGQPVIDDVPISLDSLRYFPHTMEEEIFDMGMSLWDKKIEEVETTNTTIGWEFEMYVFNKMFYTQRNKKYLDGEITLSHLDNSKKYHRLMVDGFTGNNWNPCDVEDASVLIFSATRGHREQLELMKKFHTKYNFEKITLG